LVLEWVEFVDGADTFDGGDRAASDCNRKNETRAHDVPVQENATGAAGTLLTSGVGSGEPELVAQRVKQGLAGFDRCLKGFPVDDK
jgi:hypothetical protein